MHPFLGHGTPWKPLIWGPVVQDFSLVISQKLRDVEVSLATSDIHALLHAQEMLQLRMALVAILCLMGVSALYLLFARESPEKSLTGTRAALMSLYAVITPTQSFWPTQYLSTARSAAARNKGSICVPLTTLYRDLLDDTVELRHPREHLPLLFTGKLSTPTRILVDVDISWWIKLYLWMFSCYMRNGNSCPTPVTKYDGPALDSSQLSLSPPPPYLRAPQDPADISAATAPPSTLFFSMLYESTPSISLDCIPYHTLEGCIRQIQSTLAPGTYLTIGLTTRAGPAAHNFSGPTTILTALPFFPREYLRGRSENKSEGGGSERTSMPLFVTLPRVLGLLTSGPSPLTVELVRNVSAEYAAFLRRSVHDLEDDWEIRDAFVREWGLRAWREERVCTAWEAALVDAGLLAGWAIVVHKAEK